MTIDKCIDFLLDELGSEPLSRTYLQECSLVFAIRVYERDIERLYGYSRPEGPTERLENFVNQIHARVRKLEDKE